MKRGMSGKTRRGSPPLPRQRKALRIVQATLVGLALCLVVLAASAVNQRRHPLPPTATLGAPGGHGLGEVVALAGGAIALGGLAGAMGVRVVRGPDPHLPEQGGPGGSSSRRA
jgi:hypothetical protein